MPMARVLFPEPFMITQVAAARALGRRGDVCDVAWAYSSIKKHFKSKFVERVHKTAVLAENPDGFARDVLQLCQRNSYDVLLPLNLESTEALLPFKDALRSQTGLLLPTAEQLSIGADKGRTAQLCEELDIPHPRTWHLKDRDELERLREEVEYPVVIKHARNLGGSRGVRIVGNVQEFQSACDYLQELRASDTPLLVQEYIPGLLFDAVGVAKDGYCPRMFTAARKLMYPISGGVTCISVSTRSSELKELSAKIIDQLNWTGPIEIEFKLDARDGQYKLIEINPRFWASLGASVKCNVNFAAIAVDLAMGRKVETDFEHEVGHCHKFLLGRVPYAYWQLARDCGRKALIDPQSYVRTSNDIDFRDPVPDIFDSMLLLRDLLIGKFPRKLSDGEKMLIQSLDAQVPYD